MVFLHNICLVGAAVAAHEPYLSHECDDFNVWRIQSLYSFFCVHEKQTFESH